MNQSIGGVKNRRKGALERLQNQLKSGVKIPKGVNVVGYSDFQQQAIPLTESDINRINKEINILKTRV